MVYMAPYVHKKKEQMMHGWGTFGMGNTMNSYYLYLALSKTYDYPPSHMATLNSDSPEHPFILKGCYCCWLLAFVIFFSSPPTPPPKSSLGFLKFPIPCVLMCNFLGNNGFMYTYGYIPTHVVRLGY
jgi:hypothetical protein